TLDRTTHLGAGTGEGLVSVDGARREPGRGLDADAWELRNALARAIGALRNACVGAASSTADLLGGEDPTGFAEEVRALASAHEKELAAELTKGTVEGAGHTGNANKEVSATGSTATQGHVGRSGTGLEFWSRQSDLWSGVFAEQQMGLLQMVRAQEAELRQ
ncbi:unnamed protein product, partial [Ascophyllum nodosum]